jgi:tetratricopeptide (TPR) repeat protein
VARTAAARATARAERRARHRLAGLSAAVLLLAGAVGWWLFQRAEAARAVATALVEVTDAQQRRDWPAARLALERAEGLLAGGGGGEARERVRRVREDLDALARLEDLLNRSSPDWKSIGGRGEDDRFAQAFRGLGIDPQEQTPAEMARRLRARSIPEELAACLDGWAWVRRQGAKSPDRPWRPLVEAARLADPDPTRTRLRTLLLGKDRRGLERLAAGMKLAAHSPLTLALVGQYLREVREDAAIDFLRKARRHYPADYWLNHLLGAALFAPLLPDSYQEAIGPLSAALALRPRSVGTLKSLAMAHIFGGHFDEGIRLARRILALGPYRLTRAHAHDLIGMALGYKGDLGGALAEYRRAVRLAPDEMAFRYNQAVVLLKAGDRKGALAACRAAIRLAPGNAGATTLLGDIRSAQGKLGEAAAAYRKSLRQHTNPTFLTMTLIKLAEVLRRRSAYAEALKVLRRAARIGPRKPDIYVGLGDTL